MSNLITIRMEGSKDQQGHVLAADFMQKLENLLSALNGIDRIESKTDKLTLNYRIVAATHSSPLSVSLEPFYRTRARIEGSDHIERRNKRFFGELNAIRAGIPLSPEVDETLLECFSGLADGLGEGFTRTTILNGMVSVEIDQNFETNVRKLLNEEDASYGGEEGMLEAINLHGSPRCWIYPKIGAAKMRCDFQPGMKDLVVKYIGRFIRVEGVKFFRPHSPYAFRIAAKELIPLEEESAISLHSIRGIAPDATGSITATDFVRKLRDEWE